MKCNEVCKEHGRSCEKDHEEGEFTFNTTLHSHKVHSSPFSHVWVKPNVAPLRYPENEEYPDVSLSEEVFYRRDEW